MYAGYLVIVCCLSSTVSYQWVVKVLQYIVRTPSECVCCLCMCVCACVCVCVCAPCTHSVMIVVQLYSTCVCINSSNHIISIIMFRQLAFSSKDQGVTYKSVQNRWLIFYTCQIQCSMSTYIRSYLCTLHCSVCFIRVFH